MKKLEVRIEKVVEVSDWNEFIKEIYGRPYDFQQQDGCMDRGVFRILVPQKYYDDYEATSIPEIVNGPDMGVSFEAWLARDPKTPLSEDDSAGDSYALKMWWERNFFPNIDMIINDLHKRGLLEAGEYAINIDW